MRRVAAVEQSTVKLLWHLCVRQPPLVSLLSWFTSRSMHHVNALKPHAGHVRLREESMLVEVEDCGGLPGMLPSTGYGEENCSCDYSHRRVFAAEGSLRLIALAKVRPIR
mmetsp:Transcript_22826/g.52856  ORF Transcript_22826/g.52856 Transcript_22826/m.52856 type:complete len:110 (+) Transcript_22826:1135-1464(+)